MKSMKETALVTGGAGFIGSHVAETLAGAGWKVIVLDDLSRGRSFGRAGLDSSRYNWRFLRTVRGVRRVRGSVTNAKLVRELTADVDAIVHLAGQVAVTTSVTDPLTDFRTNVIGTFNVLEAARLSRKSPRMVFASTNKVYGENVNAIPVTERSSRYEFCSRKFSRGISEDLPIDRTHHSPYGASKLCGDLYVQEYGQTYGLSTGVFRMSCIYGPRQVGVADQGWLAHFVLTALQGGSLTIYGDGKQVRDVLFVTDLVAAYLAFLISRRGSSIFNIGGGPQNTLSLIELIGLLESKLMHRIRCRHRPWRPADQKVYISDISKLRRILDWKPRVPPVRGVEQLISWARELVMH
jgi:CDP-paratose 2-epimerase